MKNERKKILALTDGLGWICDRIAEKMEEEMPQYEFTRRHYTSTNPSEFRVMASKFDLIHYHNSDVDWLKDELIRTKTPWVLSIRSYRYPAAVIGIAPHATKVHVVNADLKRFFPTATFIPDAIWDWFHASPKPVFTVGFSGKPDSFKGFYMIQKACELEKVRFSPALNVAPNQMPDYYKSVSMVVIASESEGANTIAGECMAMNVPFVTVKTGHFGTMDVCSIERSVESIRLAIRQRNTAPQVEAITWKTVCAQFADLYEAAMTKP